MAKAPNENNERYEPEVKSFVENHAKINGERMQQTTDAIPAAAIRKQATQNLKLDNTLIKADVAMIQSQQKRLEEIPEEDRIDGDNIVTYSGEQWAAQGRGSDIPSLTGYYFSDRIETGNSMAA